jgi:MerR family mercuric resistance operon transcriptional regulator
MGANRALTIGRLAKSAGVHVETVRYYQRRGLIGEPSKPPGGQRHYPAAMVQRLGFIRRAQQLGFSLEEVKRLLDLAGGDRCREARFMAEEKRAVLAARIVELTRMRRELQRHVDACGNRKRGEPCSFLEALKGAG